MIHPKFICWILACAFIGFLSSCIDSREEYWLQADGSGRFEITCRFPAAAAAVYGGESGMRTMITRFLKDTPEISDSRFEVVTEGERLRVQINTTFGSAHALQKTLSGERMKSLPSAASHLAGEVTTGLSGRTLDFSREISVSKALPGAAFLPASRLEGHRLTYIMHLPVAPGESNATRVENNGRTLIWDVPLARAVRAPVITRFKMALPIPWLLVAAIAVVVTLAGGLVFIRIRRSGNQPDFPTPDFPGGNP